MVSVCSPIVRVLLTSQVWATFGPSSPCGKHLFIESKQKCLSCHSYLSKSKLDRRGSMAWISVNSFLDICWLRQKVNHHQTKASGFQNWMKNNLKLHYGFLFLFLLSFDSGRKARNIVLTNNCLIIHPADWLGTLAFANCLLLQKTSIKVVKPNQTISYGKTKTMSHLIHC